MKLLFQRQFSYCAMVIFYFKMLLLFGLECGMRKKLCITTAFHTRYASHLLQFKSHTAQLLNGYALLQRLWTYNFTTLMTIQNTTIHSYSMIHKMGIDYLRWMVWFENNAKHKLQTQATNSNSPDTVNPSTCIHKNKWFYAFLIQLAYYKLED